MEIWDLYDKNYNKLNKTMVRGGEVPDGCYRFVVHMCVFNTHDEMLISRRQDDKESYPGYWELSASGSKLSGESSEEAVKRELYEEIGMDLFDAELRPSLTAHFDTGFHDICIVEKDIPISQLNFQQEEVQDAKWASKEEILKMIDDDTFIPYRKSLVHLLFDMKTSRGIRKE